MMLKTAAQDKQPQGPKRALSLPLSHTLDIHFPPNHNDSSDTSNPTKQTHLITSPYTTAVHQLRLQTLDPQARLLAQALTILAPTRPDFATAPYTDSFNWAAVFAHLDELCKREKFTWGKESREYFVVVFRSVLRPGADLGRLRVLDERSHQEAVASGGLLRYWFGAGNCRGENLATCIWRNKPDAQRGGAGPWHKKARGAAREMYERIEFGMLRLVVGHADGDGDGDAMMDWRFDNWEE